MSATAISELTIAVKPSLSASELDDVAALVSEARWNQVAADWRVFTQLGRVHAAQTATGGIVATTATLPYGGRFAWVSMVLVAGPYRRRGLATLLMRRAMDELAGARLVPVLDATPDGRAVYLTLGFEDSWGFERLRCDRAPTEAAPRQFHASEAVRIRAIADEDWPALCAYDAAAFGAQRSAVLASLRGRWPPAELIAQAANGVCGFCLGRDGRVAAHIGPLVAEDDGIACALLDRALHCLEAPVIIDLADAKPQVRAFLQGRGFAPVRPFTRMLHGRNARFDDAARTFAVVGPEFG